MARKVHFHYRTQAERIISKFGGAVRLSRLMGLNRSSVCRWTYPKSKGGSGGIVPTRSLGEILKLCRLEGVMLTEDDLNPRVLEVYEKPEVHEE